MPDAFRPILGRAAVALCLAGCWSAAAAEEAGSPVGKSIGEFALRCGLGAEFRLSDFADRPLVVVAFLGTECPLAKLYAPRLEAIARKYAERGVAVLGINANQQDSNTELVGFGREHGITFPLLKDPGNVVADQFGAVRTPEVFLLDRERTVRYWGRVDDQFGVGLKRAKVQRADLELAIEDLLAGRGVAVPQTEAPGCLIGRVRMPDENAAVTWSGQVARIMQEHCQDCHRPGEVAPFPLLEYEDAVGWAEMIGEVVEQGRMPPWHADPRHGDFSNSMRLPPDAKQVILDWVAAGAPQGDPAQAPPPREFSEGWQIPEPDQVVYIAEKPFVVPADGVVEYQWFVVDPHFTEDKWIMAVECRPGNRAVVHHVTVYFQPPGVDWNIDLGRRINFLGGFAPGKKPVVMEQFDGTARFLPAGSKLVFEMHYTPNGSVQTDRSSVAMVFAKPEEVKRQLSLVLVANNQFAIPPHASDAQVTSSYTFEEDSLLYSMSPHMHLRGKSFRFTARYPDGQREILCEVPRFDFNWQHDYMLREPKRMPRGTVMECLATFDNSAENPANPDPDATVRWGDQTWEEMMIGAIGFVAEDQDLLAGTGKPAEVLGGPWKRIGRAALAVAAVVIGLALAWWGVRLRRAPTPQAVA